MKTRPGILLSDKRRLSYKEFQVPEQSGISSPSPRAAASLLEIPRREEPRNLYHWNSLTEKEWMQICIPPAWMVFAGTYVIFGGESGKECLYVGQSKNILKRLRNHNIRPRRYSAWWETPWGTLYPNLKLSVKKEKRLFERMMTEARLIKKLKPKFNKINGIGW